MKIYTPSYLNEIGGRGNNEDSIFPEPKTNTPTENDRLFVVCDGVGGQEKGEVASKFASQYFYQFANENPSISDPKNWMTAGLKYIENKIYQYLESHPESKGMATTLTVIYLDDIKNQAVIGWVGDSRVYHIRDGLVLFQTKDHSLVQSLIDHGEITEEEAETHPQKNVITRAINGHEPTRIDVKVIDNISKNDFFFLCTDGILENIGKEEIQSLFTEDKNPDVIKSEILGLATGNTKDNFSMYLIKVQEVNQEVARVIKASKNKCNQVDRSFLRTVFIALISMILGAILVLYLKPSSEIQDPNSSPLDNPQSVEENPLEPTEETINLQPGETVESEQDTEDEIIAGEHVPIKSFRIKGEAEIWGLGKVEVDAEIELPLLELPKEIIIHYENDTIDGKVRQQADKLIFTNKRGDTINTTRKELIRIIEKLKE